MVRITGIDRDGIRGDIRFVDAPEKMGVTAAWGDDFIACARGELKAINMDMDRIPGVAMTVVAATLFVQRTIALRNIYN